MPDMPLEITNFFLAMQAGPPGLDLLKSLFAEDAVYSEPFSGQTEPHRGAEAIAAAFAASRSEDFDDAVITLDAVDVAGETITVEWTCISAAIPGGRGSGRNVFTLEDGRITALVTSLHEGQGS